MRTIQVGHPVSDRGPCLPAALAAILGKTFNQVNGWLVAVGARNYNVRLKRAVRGTHLSGPDYRLLGFERISPEKHKVEIEYKPGQIRLHQEGSFLNMKPMTVNNFVKSHPKGTFMLSSGHHAVGLKDGIVYDVQKDSSKMRLVYVYQQIGPCTVDFEKYGQFGKPKPKKGDKRLALLDLINQTRIFEPSVLARKANVSYVYARSIVIMYKQLHNIS